MNISLLNVNVKFNEEQDKGKANNSIPPCSSKECLHEGLSTHSFEYYDKMPGCDNKGWSQVAVLAPTIKI